MLNRCWACYHSKLYTFHLESIEIGIVPFVIGSSYAVLVAEQLFVSGCTTLLSVTSAGVIRQPKTYKKQVLITSSIRDEGASWTTDAPYRKTPSAIQRMQEQNITCVEMESSALYALSEARRYRIICFAHLTNSMAQAPGDFEKGAEFGSIETLSFILYVVNILYPVYTH